MPFAAAVAAFVLVASGCSPLVRPPTFAGARDHVADASLVGPFDGQLVDGTTYEPIAGATVVGVWDYERGDGQSGRYGLDIRSTTTDLAGRYQLRGAPGEIRGARVKLVGFTLLVYKRGFLGYRSDVPYGGGLRSEFVARHNRIELRKWTPADSHADHLLMLAPPPEIELLTAWERPGAETDALRTGEAPPGAEPTPAALELLDASSLLPADEIRKRTGYTDPFEAKELTDLARTHFFHGIHMQAVGREEQWDVGYRVWRKPPGGLDPVIATFETSLPDVKPSGEITTETWVFDDPRVRAVAFVDRDREVAVLLTCGGLQCVDIETAILLARHIHDRLDAITTAPAPADKRVPNTGEGAPQ